MLYPSRSKVDLLLAFVLYFVVCVTAEIRLRIGGATLPEVIYKESTLFFNKRYQNEFVATYEPVGSARGRIGLMEGEYDIGCVDTYIPMSGVHYFPTIASPISAFHSVATLKSHKTLLLSRKCLGDIFAGKY